MKKIIELPGNEKVVFSNLISTVNLSNMNVLEVGGVLDRNIISHHKVLKWTSIDTSANEEINSNDYVVIKKKFIDKKFDYNSFDLIFSSNAFHYFENLNKDFIEFYKILKKGGKLFTHFGPIWSSPDGHCIENIRLSNGSILNFWENSYIPKWGHLLPKEELESLLQNNYLKEDIQLIIDYLNSNKPNKMFYKDYFDMITNSNFKIKQIITSEIIDYEIKSVMSDELIKSKLRSIYGVNDYDCRSIMLLLEK